MAIYPLRSPTRAAPRNRNISPKPSAAADPSIQMPSGDCDDFFGPAIDRPPSADMIRKVNRQMKESYLRAHHHNIIARSASSSMSSIVSESGASGAWEQPLDSTASTARRPFLSLADKMSNRDRDHHATSFSRNIRERRRQSKREHSIAHSAASSVYSNDSSDSGPSHLKESLMPHLFSRRKPSRDDLSHKRFQISNPFNFKHILHTDREDLSGSQVARPSNLLAMKATGPSPTQTHGRFAPESFSSHHHTMSTSVNIGKSESQSAARNSLSNHSMRRVRSQEDLRIVPSAPSSPQRPSMPPKAQTSPVLTSSSPPRPPLRISSRLAAYGHVGEKLASLSLTRPKTSGSLRRTQPFNPTISHDEPLPLLPNSFPPPPPYANRRDMDAHGPTITPSSTWPLAGPAVASFETPLPDVPEEEEQREQSRRSHLSVASNQSLKNSHSAPMLRVLPKSQRPISGLSETLGHLEITESHAYTTESLEDDFQFGVAEESWEDDIDYCYEHEAEANCDYQWERTSVDTTRRQSLSGGFLPGGQAQMPIGTAHSSPGMLSVPVLDKAPAYPVGQAATITGDELVGSTSPSRMPSNFSLPRVGRLRVRASHASSFKESHGFTLSPSLLIPDEFHHQLLMEKGFRESLDEDDEEAFMGLYRDQLPASQLDESTSSLSTKLAQWLHQRSSTSTTATSSTSRTESSIDRHHSANSSWSFLTRPTTSSTSVSRITLDVTEPAVANNALGKSLVGDSQDDVLSSPEQDVVPELPSSFSHPGKTSYHKSHASESVIRSDGSPSTSGFEPPASRRARSRTASMCTHIPPVGQYSLFPRSQIRPTGDQI